MEFIKNLVDDVWDDLFIRIFIIVSFSITCILVAMLLIFDNMAFNQVFLLFMKPIMFSLIVIIPSLVIYWICLFFNANKRF